MSEQAQPETDDVGPLEEFTTEHDGDYDPSWDNDPADEPPPAPAPGEDEPDDYDPEV